MPLIPVACHKCGAPLEVPDEARFVTCRHCGIQLEVKHNESAAWTEQIEDIKEQTEELVEQVAQLQYQNALESIDRDWERQRDKMLVTHENGRRTEPSITGAIIGTVIALVMGLFIAANFNPGFGALVAVIGVGAGVFGVVKANDFETAKRRHKQRKANLKLDDFRNKAASGESFNSDSAKFDSWGKDS